MQEHERWLAIAREDLKAAQALIKIELFSSATYHCQQAAEKSLKAYLVFKKQETLKTHDLLKLDDLCKNIDKEFQKLDATLEILNPFATKFRYPSEFDIPDEEKVELIVKEAKKVLSFVLKKIEESMSGQMEIR
jgi:HEPN domain-containing protein